MLDSVPEREWRKLQRAKEDAEHIRQRASGIVRGLAEAFARNDMPDRIGFSVACDEASGLGTISTPFYDGRFRLYWSVGEKLAGVLIAERKACNHRDELIWQPALGVTIQVSETPSVGEGPDALKIYIDHESGRYRKDALFSLGMSILFAFAHGPRPDSGK